MGEGNTLWRIVCFSSSSGQLKRSLRSRKWLARDFKYDADAYETRARQREDIDKQLNSATDMVKGMLKAAWSDAMVSWMHVKAALVFVDGVLRFGMPPSLAAFVVSPKASRQANARKALDTILGC